MGNTSGTVHARSARATNSIVETLAERYDRARMFFDAGDFVTASRMLADIVAEVPEDVATRLLLARSYYHSAQLQRAEAELRCDHTATTGPGSAPAQRSPRAA